MLWDLRLVGNAPWGFSSAESYCIFPLGYQFFFCSLTHKCVLFTHKFVLIWGRLKTNFACCMIKGPSVAPGRRGMNGSWSWINTQSELGCGSQGNSSQKCCCENKIRKPKSNPLCEFSVRSHCGSGHSVPILCVLTDNATISRPVSN